MYEITLKVNHKTGDFVYLKTDLQKLKPFMVVGYYIDEIGVLYYDLRNEHHEDYYSINEIYNPTEN